MHIKRNPISKNNEFAGFELDTSKIELRPPSGKPNRFYH